MTHIGSPPGEGSVYLDENHAYQLARMPDGELVGIVESHFKDGRWCAGFVAFRDHNPEHGWDVLSLDPLSLSPSLLCRLCGEHGFIRDGQWVPA